MPPIIGGPSIPYVAIPTNNKAGITMGGTRYLMVSSLLEKRLGVVFRAALQFTEEYRRRQGKADDEHAASPSREPADAGAKKYPHAISLTANRFLRHFYR